MAQPPHPPPRYVDPSQYVGTPIYIVPTHPDVRYPPPTSRPPPNAIIMFRRFSPPPSPQEVSRVRHTVWGPLYNLSGNPLSQDPLDWLTADQVNESAGEYLKDWHRQQGTLPEFYREWVPTRQQLANKKAREEQEAREELDARWANRTTYPPEGGIVGLGPDYDGDVKESLERLEAESKPQQ